LIRTWGQAMPRPYSVDLRVRVIGDISTGASRREGPNAMGSAPVWWCFGSSALSRPEALRQGRVAAAHRRWRNMLGLITEQPDLTLDELVAAMRKRGIPECGLAVLRSARHQPQKKPCTLRSKSARRLLASAEVWIGSDRSGRRKAALSSAVLARPQSDRAGHQQSEGSPALGLRAHHSASIAPDRTDRADFSAKECRNFFRHAGCVQI